MRSINAASRARLPVLVAAFVCALFGSGCSFTFSNPPPNRAERGHARPHFDCSTSYVPPIADTVLASYEVTRAALALSAEDRDYEHSPIPRQTDAALGAAFALLFIASASYGYQGAYRCRRIHQAPPGPTPGFD